MSREVQIARRSEVTWIVKGYAMNYTYKDFKDARTMYSYLKKEYGMAELVRKEITTTVETEYTTRWKT